VESHLKVNQHLATASHANLGTKSSFAATQAAWRFYANENTSLGKLSEPLLALSCDNIAEYCENYALIVHDWSGLNYSQHDSKKDKKVLHNRYEHGYELQSSIAVSDKNGMPLGVLVQNLVTADGVLSSYQGEGWHREPEHLQELATRVQWLEKQAINQPLVHIVDREGDAVEWLRACPSSQWLIRCRQNSTVLFEKTRYQVGELAKQLDYSTQAREVRYQGKTAYQTTAQCRVDVVRAAKPKRKQADKDKQIHGEPFSANLVVSRVVDAEGRLVAEWYLLTNVFTVSAQTVATWYYWRWQIECFFKLLKQQGLQLEDWQQESGLAIAKRLLVATQACVLVWELQQQNSLQAIEFKTFLVRLTGRQMKKTRPITPSALLEGLGLFFTLMNTLDLYSIEQLQQFKYSVNAFWGD
jgi:Transposase DDE domain